MKFLTQVDLTKIFNVSTLVINELVNAGKLPCKGIDGTTTLFCPDTILRYIVNPMNDDQYLEEFRKKL